MNNYFLIKPSEFWRYDEVDINGDYERVQMNDFNLSDDKEVNSLFNYLILEVPCKDKKGTIVYGPKATELLTGKKFDVNYVVSPYGKNIKAFLESETLGLYMDKAKKLEDISAEGSKVSGLIKYMKEHKDLFEKYCNNLNDMFNEASYYNKKVYETILGPDLKTKISLRRKFNKNVR